MPAAIAAIIGWVAKGVGSEAVRGFALKALIWAIVCTVLPIVLYNFVSDLMQEMLEMVSAKSATYAQGMGTAPFLIQLSGVVGWLAVKLKLPESFSIIISAVVFRLGIGMIPFVKV